MSNISPLQRKELENLHKSRQFQLAYPRQILGKAEKHLNEILIPLIKVRMKSHPVEYSEKIIDSVRLGNVDLDMDLGNIIYEIICDYVTVKNFDISEARESKGTIRHFIKPIIAKALRWIVGGFVVGWSKGHWVKGIVASFIIEDTMRELQPIIEKKLQDEGDILFERIMSVKL